MSSAWSLSQLLAGLHDDIQQRLETARKTFGHPGTKGNASEKVWLELLKTYLPRRYEATNAHVVDSNGTFSDQIDIVIHDRQYSPFIFHYEGETVVPAESVYAVFEAKQSIDLQQVAYAQKKIASVRTLHRTSLPIPHAGGEYPPKPLFPILGGILTLESNWNPALGDSLLNSLKTDDEQRKLNIGCIATHGTFILGNDGNYELKNGGKPATTFLLELIARLQLTATVPMIDVRAYAKWLK
jgi:hypothetical protein